MKKDVTVKLDRLHWFRLRHLAARRQTTISGIIGGWIAQQLQSLPPVLGEPDPTVVKKCTYVQRADRRFEIPEE